MLTRMLGTHICCIAMSCTFPLIAAKNIRKETLSSGEFSAILFIFVVAVLALLVYIVMNRYKLPF